MMIAIILGTRPEIIKFWSVIKTLQQKKIPFTIIHTNQHYDPNLDTDFFRDLQLPDSDYRITATYTTPAQQVGSMMIELEKIIQKINPDLVLVQGDVNSAQAGALTASKLNIPIAHIEAGLRSYDNRMQEEHNRKVCDHLAQIHFVPTQIQKDILLKEGIAEESIHVIGNTICDAITEFKDKSSPDEFNKLNLKKQEYVLLTLHRPENVDNPQELNNIFSGLKQAYNEHKLRIIFPMHPRTYKQIKQNSIAVPEFLEIIKPIRYLDFLTLIQHAKIVITDSGGIQEEACILGVPCVTTRISTERPETVHVGANLVVGTQPQSIKKGVVTMLTKTHNWQHPFGDGETGQKIVAVCNRFLSEIKTAQI